MIIKVFTDDGREVDSLTVDTTNKGGEAVGGEIYGRRESPMGWLGRALRDADIIQQGGDPERLSEKAMRLSQRKDHT